MFFNGIKLPGPLKDSEEQALINSKVQGDEMAKQELIEKNLRLVVYIAHKFTNVDSSLQFLEDIVSQGTIGLIKAVDTFRTEKNIKFATYASKCITNEILMYIRREKKHNNVYSFDEYFLNFDNGGTASLSDMIAGEDIEFKIMNSIQVDQLMTVLNNPKLKLTKKEQSIIWFRYLQSPHLKQKEVADLLGISQSYISRLEKRMLKKLREKLS